MKMPSSKKRAYQVYKAAKEIVGASTTIYALSVELTQCFQDLMELIQQTHDLRSCQDFELPHLKISHISNASTISFTSPRAFAFAKSS